MADTPGIVTQPHLGRMRENYKPHSNMGGYLSLAKVIKVHHKHRTADISIINTRDIINSEPSNEGRFGVKIATVNASFNQTLLSSSGTIEPIQEGDLVVIAFLDNSKSKPVILGSFFNTDETSSNVLPSVYPLNPDNSLNERKEALKYLKVLPSQLYHRIDGEGGTELSYPSKSFMKVDADRENAISDAHGGFDHSDLLEKDPRTGDTRSGNTEDSILPVKVLFVHRSNFDNSKTGWTKFFLDKDGKVRLTRDNNDGTLTYTGIDADGRHIVRRQVDSNVHGEGSNYVESVTGVGGEFRITRVIGGSKSEIYMDANGKLHLSSTQSIDVSGNLSISGNLNVSGTINASAINIGGVRAATINDIVYY